MEHFVIYKTETGEITRSAFGDSSKASVALRPGEAVLLARGSIDGHFVDLESMQVLNKYPNDACLMQTEIKLGETGSMVDIDKGSTLEILEPNGWVQKPEIDKDGQAFFTPTKLGNHLWRVKSVQTFPIQWLMKVVE